MNWILIIRYIKFYLALDYFLLHNDTFDHSKRRRKQLNYKIIFYTFFWEKLEKYCTD
jgi:hypothetical protein